MGILKVSNQDPIGQKQTGRHYNPKNWDEQSEDLRGKPWAEVFDLIQKQFKHERLDMKKLKDLLGRLSPKTDWTKVVTDLKGFFAKYDQENKPSPWGEISYTEADALRGERNAFLNTLRARVNTKNDWEKLEAVKHFSNQSTDEYEDLEDVEENQNVINIENRFDKVAEVEHKRILDPGLLHGHKNLGKSDMSPVVKTAKRSDVAMDSSKRNQHVGEYYESEKLKKRISSERGARARRKDERRYF
jgi:hypothetical protein